MARVKGSTTKAGVTRTQRVSQDVTSKIEGPHGGKSPKSVGPQTQAEKDALRGIPGEGKVKQVGPTSLRPAGAVGAPGSVKVVGGGTIEDSLDRNGGHLASPQTRQEGAVKQVGPASREYSKLIEHPMPPTQTQQARFAPKRGQRIDKGVPLLVGGVGRAHAWSKYAGTPGSQPLRGGNGRRAFTSNSLMINGRPRTFTPEPFNPRRDLVVPKSVIIPGGGTGRYSE